MTRVVTATVDDYAIAVELREAMALEMQSRDFAEARGDWRARFVAYFGERQRAGEGQLFLAFEGETPIGMALISIQDDYRRSVLGVATAWVNGVYVVPAHRRSGVARMLMACVLDWARAAGCRRVRLRASEAGVPLYRQLGFSSTPETMQLDL